MVFRLVFNSSVAMAMRKQSSGSGERWRRQDLGATIALL
jgi:hypothetical protein